MTASAVGAPAVIVTVPDVVLVRPDAVNLRVRAPVVPVIARLANVAAPLAFVVAVRVPPSVPPPVEMDTVTTIPACVTALLAASRNCTTGC